MSDIEQLDQLNRERRFARARLLRELEAERDPPIPEFVQPPSSWWHAPERWEE